MAKTKQHPVGWASRGWSSRWLARWLRPREPSVLILSLPRSGSSWVGAMLGGASDALYLREPINQTCLAQGQIDSLVSVAPESAPAPFRAICEQAFAGIPNYDADIVQQPRQWRLGERRNRRLVIKEVYPGACAYFCVKFRPRLIYLVRHPAAVALSCVQRGWWSPERSTWRGLGAFQGEILREVRDFLATYPDHRIVHYEDLCRNPLRQFEALFAFAGLTWDQAAADQIVRASAGGNERDPYATSRRSLDMAGAWLRRITPEAAQELRAGFESAGLPWYHADADWR